MKNKAKNLALAESLIQTNSDAVKAALYASRETSLRVRGFLGKLDASTEGLEEIGRVVDRLEELVTSVEEAVFPKEGDLN